MIPECWKEVLSDIARIADAKGAILITWNEHMQGWTSSNSEIDALAREHFKLYPGANERTRRLLATGHAGFVTDYDVFTDDELRNEPLFREFLIPRGYGRGVATAIRSPSGDTAIIHTEGDLRRGPVTHRIVDALDTTRRHLARATFLATRLRLERARAAAQALETVGLPGALIGPAGKVIAANALFESMIPSVFEDRTNRLVATDRGADALLVRSIAETGQLRGYSSVQSIPLSICGTDEKAVLHLIPVRRNARDIFPMASAIVIVSTLNSGRILPEGILEGLFDLTPAEARVAAAIVAGRTVIEIAEASKTSPSTVRNQLKSVLAKTGMRRQAELSALLANVTLPISKPDRP